MSIRPVLDTLLITLQRVDPPQASLLVEGLDRELIASRLSSLPVHIASEVVEYFAWRNGLRADRQVEYELFPEAVMLSLDEALTDYRMLCDIAANISKQAGVPASMVWDERWLPLFRHPAGGAYHVTVGGAAPAVHAPILSILQEDVSGASVAFESLETLATRANQWLLQKN
jgi:cell wall assembly regulator SMI1